MLCKLGFHKWDYLPNKDNFGNDKGGKPTNRICCKCEKKQTWHYDIAREKGLIYWINYE